MLKGINYWAFPPDSRGKPIDPLEALKKAKDLEYDCFEFTVEEKGAVSLDMSEGDAEKIKGAAEAAGIRLLTVASGLSWSFSPTDPEEVVRERAVKNSKRILEIASWLGAESILYVPGMVSAVFIPDFEPQLYDYVDKRAKESLKQIIPLAEKLQVKIGIENVWNRFLLSPAEMRAFIDYFDSEYVGSYFDVGNVLLYGHPEQWITMLGKRIFAVHLKDFRVNVGNLDGFVDLLDGDVNYRSVMVEFAKIGYNGPFTAEIVPGREGAAEKAIVSMKIIEKMRGEGKQYG